MPDRTFSASMPVRPLPIVMPEVTQDFRSTWRERAICAGEDPNTFFPASGDPGIRARQVCASCPVRADCLKRAIADDEWGIWAGLDRDQRRALRQATNDQGELRDHALAHIENREQA